MPKNLILLAGPKALEMIRDRGDFKKFKRDDNDRISYWKTVADTCRVLADDFHEAIETGKIKDLVKPI